MRARAVMLTAVFVTGAPLFVAEPPGGEGQGSALFSTYVGNGGVDSGVAVRRRLSEKVNPTGRRTKPQQRYQVVYVPVCQGNSPGGRQEECAAAFTACQRTGQGRGPLSTIYQRALTPTLGPWQPTGHTCHPPRPATTPTPAIPSLTSIRTAWAHTPFAKPQTTIQPPGGTTLTGLPTYFTVTWPATGYPPGHHRTLTLAGHRVHIRPTLRTVTYHLGGPAPRHTRSLGGPYPTGDVQHTYQQPGTYRIRTTITYGGEYAIDDGPWHQLPDTTTIAGPTTTLTVRAAHTHLTTDADADAG